jgi:hypothetical protein
MAKIRNSKAVSIENGVVSFLLNTAYSFEYQPKGGVKIVAADGPTTVLSASEFAALTTLNITPGLEVDLTGAAASLALNLTGVTFTEAGPGGPFEAGGGYDLLLGNLIQSKGIVAVVDQLMVNGNKGDVFKLLWDFLDDPYVADGDYYNTPVNQSFVRLGVEYAKYLEGGGEPLTDVTAKFGPARDQSLHDNLLGNLNLGSVESRNFPPAVKAELLGLIPDEYETRPVFSGNLSDVGGAAHDSVRAFDYDKGWARPDYVDRFFGKVDPSASDDRNGDGVDEQMFYGTLNGNGSFNVVRHEGAGVELALKAKEFGPNGGDTLGTPTFIDGVAHYKVSAGASPDDANRADWSFDYAATVLAQGADEAFTFKLRIDIDETEGVNLVDLPTTTFSGLTQGSSNYAFLRSLIDTDDTVEGIQPYAYGPGEFDIVLEAHSEDGLVASNRIVVHVDGFGL